MINQHYKNRYDRFIQYIRSLNRTISGYSENHHIQPSCLKGTNDPDNMIELTLREHHIAHWLLWKAYPNYLPLSSAFLQMCNKNPALGKTTFKPIPSRVYEQLKTEVYRSLGALNADKVRVKDNNGHIIVLTKEEYAKQNELKFHTTGKVVVYDTETKSSVSITTTEYHMNKDRYIPNCKSNNCKGKGNGYSCWSEYIFLDQETGATKKMTRESAKLLNIEIGYKRYTQVLAHKVRATDNEGNTTIISLKEYQTGNYKHSNAETVKVHDKYLDKKVSIPRRKYFSDPNRYVTSTKGKVLVKDDNGKSKLIPREEFQAGNHLGHTFGLTAALDQITGEYVQITKEEFSRNRDRYSGPNKGKVNVIDKSTGERLQIPKNEFIKELYAGLGNKTLLFRARNRLTGTEKNINIYEWELVKTEYEIIDVDQFNKANSLK